MGCTSDLYAAGLKPLLDPVHPVEMGSSRGHMSGHGFVPPPCLQLLRQSLSCLFDAVIIKYFKSATAVESCTTGMGPLARMV